ncbi:C4-dicarboxylate ABC transporter [Escherichia coli]|uniref:C4-dicarboxylate transporter n=6 Tax=Enterobacteriaceae TaxID=543 RepID=A0A7W3DA64_CITFR|nr:MULTISPECIES: anaerobic C4-dicarboxylate transporter [Enterobacteriaceae]HAT7506909.1 anaerobic C4-dicarboxylate transporter [Citrobacter braakii]HBZ7748363.1 anaerobic C4-dicarboxylate transporter [Klebsiella variicola subsp. variicola]EEX2877723.1 anaerobic C4-dicarboxylate transporter [Escherichia coli]EFH5696647.1 anaerobic C4-dicarboxylate transporter [Escherichia coli]EFH6540422.1 anaerobic C4-dicarboxylate transporter [Escherichia coli]
MFWTELCFILIALMFGARIGGVFLGMVGGLGVGVLVFGFGLTPSSPPIDVILIILSVVLAASSLQASGGLTLLVRLAEKMLRRHPRYITLLAPFICYIFTFMSGTGHVVYSLLPVISEVARDSGIRPERPLSISVIASQQAITASPISAAMAAMIGLMAPFGISISTIMMICVPATLIGVATGALATFNKGKELKDDPEYQRRLAEGLLKPNGKAELSTEIAPHAKLSVLLFLSGAVVIVLLGLVPGLRPMVETAKGLQPLSMSAAIQIVMLSFACLIVLLCRPPVDQILSGSVFRAGALAIVCAFGLAWMSETFVSSHIDLIKSEVQVVLQEHTWLIAIMMFFVSAMVSSQAATTLILLPLGLALGLPAYALIGSWPAVNGYFFIPVAGQCLAALAFDDTGTTRIGKYVLNHSFMRPGLVNVIVSVAMGLMIGKMILG